MLSDWDLASLDRLADGAKHAKTMGVVYRLDQQAWTEIELYAIACGIREPDEEPTTVTPTGKILLPGAKAAI